MQKEITNNLKSKIMKKEEVQARMEMINYLIIEEQEEINKLMYLQKKLGEICKRQCQEEKWRTEAKINAAEKITYKHYKKLTEIEDQLIDLIGGWSNEKPINNLGEINDFCVMVNKNKYLR